MKFVVKTIGSSCLRVGNLSDLRSNAAISLKTPICFVYARAGCIPHLSFDLLQKVFRDSFYPLHIPLVSVIQITETVGEFGNFQKFIGVNEQVPICIALHDPLVAVPAGYNDKLGISLWPRGGRRHLNPTQFIKTMETLKPDIYQALCDIDTDKESTKKRVHKSVDRSLEFLDECLKKHATSEVLQKSAVFGSILGGFDPKERLKSARETSKKDVAGFIFDGFASSKPDSLEEQFDDITTLLKDTISELPAEKPRIVYGAYNPYQILELVELGIDIFDTTYPVKVSEKGEALTFNLSFDIPKSDSKSEQFLQVDLNDKRFCDNFTPIVKGCTCYTCQNHTCAYIHHLLVTSEMLAKILLMLHNLHHFQNFFRVIRESIDNQTFQDLKSLIKLHM